MVCPAFARTTEVHTGIALTLAAFRPHCPHFSRRRAASRLPPPAANTQSWAPNVFTDRQPPHSTRTLQPKRRTSPPVLTCFVDILPR